MQIVARKVYFIKLGRGGEWEKECLENGTLRFGYKETPHEIALAEQWDAVKSIWKDLRGDTGAATSDTRQIRTFYETDEQDIFVTFANGLMYWCHPQGGEPEQLLDQTRRRKTVNGWHHQSASGSPLTKDRLSGDLLKVQMYQGTICDVKASDYLLRKLNDQLSPELAEAEKAESAFLAAITPLMQRLSPRDFELLVELIFAQSGWRRTSMTGGVQKDVDLDLELPTTQERAFVQIKSSATNQDLKKSIQLLEESATYKRMFFVWHSGAIQLPQEINEYVTLIGPERLPRMIMDSGLALWLRNKVIEST